jgi:hypothetical protein
MVQQSWQKQAYWRGRQTVSLARVKPAHATVRATLKLDNKEPARCGVGMVGVMILFHWDCPAAAKIF